jgi:signal transduction histidine kinase
MLRRTTAWLASLDDSRSQHLVFLGHVWLLAPLLLWWVRDNHVKKALGDETITLLQPVVGIVLLYLLIRTYVAWRDPPRLRWDYLFPPIDVVIITTILCLSHRGPMSNIAWLFFLPIIEAAASLSVPWSASVGLMVVIGTMISASFGLQAQHDLGATSLRELWQEDSLNVIFRLYFLIVTSSLMTYQALIAAGMKQKLAVSADRTRIAAEMHDGVQGHLITIATQMELLSKLAARDPARAIAIADDARVVARQGADELRFLVQRMRAPALTNGFIPALKQYAHNICSRHGLELEFEVVGENRDLSPVAEGALFRLAQEALNNVIKHANARAVKIELKIGERTCLRIVDDGGGFERGSVSGEGLDGMGHRIHELGGSVEVSSQPGKGTSVEASL